MEAAANGDADTVRLLSSHGANLVLRNAGGETAIDIATKSTRGAAVAYEVGQLVTGCGYCGGEIYRVALARRTRKVATEEKEQASLPLDDAMV